MSTISGTLKKARKLLRARQFYKVIHLLEPEEDNFRESVDYYYYLGTACLYQGDNGGAKSYFDAARMHTVSDSRLLLAQAALFLCRGEVDRAVEYYLDVLEHDGNNKIARRALQTIHRQAASAEGLLEFISSGGARRFYPPLGVHPAVKHFTLLMCLLLVAGIGISFVRGRVAAGRPLPRSDLSAFMLSVDQKNNALQEDLSGDTYRYILNARQVNEAYEAAMRYCEEYRDNAAQVEINRLLNSNASKAIQQNARMMMQRFKEPTFDSFTDNIPYPKVAEDPYLYIDCWVVWKGRITNAHSTAAGYRCDLLVGYEDLRRVEGIVPVAFDMAMEIDATLPLQVLGKIGVGEDGKLFVKGKSIYQPRDGSSL